MHNMILHIMCEVSPEGEEEKRDCDDDVIKTQLHEVASWDFFFFA